MAHVFLGLGSNIGDREEHLRNAIKILSEIHQVSRISSIYQSEPFYYLQQPPFLNCVVEMETSLAPLALLQALKHLEHQIGREETFRNGPRVIDLDILVYDDLCLDTPELTLPHPRLQERPFVMIPLVEIAPTLMIPLLRKTASELLEHCPGRHLVKIAR